MTRVVSQQGGVNLAQGMPNFPPPPELLEAAHRAIDGDFHQYAITWGTPPLRQAIADKYRTFYGLTVDPERHVTVCCGSTETMLSTLRAVPGARLARDHGRDLRAHRLRRPRPYADRNPAGDGRAHDHDLGHLQVLLGHRLARRLRDRVRGAEPRHPARPRLRHRRRAPPA